MDHGTEQKLFAVADLSTSTITLHSLYSRETISYTTCTNATKVKQYMPVAVTTVITYTIHMTDNMIPFDPDATADPSTESTTNKPVVNIPEDDVFIMNQLEDRLAGLARLVDGVGEMLSNWQTGEESYTRDDLGVVERMLNSVEQALVQGEQEPAE